MKYLLSSLAIIILITISSCSTGTDKSRTTSADTVVVKLDTLSRAGQFTKSNGEICRQRVRIEVFYPSHYRNKKATARLQRLFVEKLLDLPDSLSMKKAIALFGEGILIQDTPQNVTKDKAGNTTDRDIDVLDIDEITMDVKINIVYNDNNIVSFVKEENVTKNGKLTSTVHHYFNLDLQAMALIELNRLFTDESLDEITAILKQKLLEQNNVETEDELNELGYFNLPNLVVNNNFFFTAEGLTWSFEPATLAINAVGEPQITLSFDELERFTLDNSLLNRF